MSCVFLILFGILGQFSLSVSTEYLLCQSDTLYDDPIAVPNPVLGGVTMFVFMSVLSLASMSSLMSVTSVMTTSFLQQ